VTVTLTDREQAALEAATAALNAGRGSVTADWIAARLGWTTRQASGVLVSLSRKGALKGLADSFVNRTFYVLPR
jgi:hypothetical protein